MKGCMMQKNVEDVLSSIMRLDRIKIKPSQDEEIFDEWKEELEHSLHDFWTRMIN
jgi:hypothetical protein